MDIKKIEALSDLIFYGICPFIVLLDFSYLGLRKDMNFVFDICIKWWRSLEELPTSKIIGLLPKKITEIFNAVYGVRHFSLKCAFRSIICSILAMFFMGTIVNIVDLSGIGSHNILYYIQLTAKEIGARSGIHPVFVVFLVIFVNLIVDYFSLLETRWVLSYAVKASAIRTIALTLIDYVFTTLLWGLGFALFVNVFNLFSGNIAIPFPDYVNSIGDIALLPLLIFLEWLNHGAIASNKGVAIGQFVLLFGGSTYFTSIIFYLFSITSLNLKVFNNLSEKAVGVLKYYSREKSPRPLILAAAILGALSKLSVALIKITRGFF